MWSSTISTSIKFIWNCNNIKLKFSAAAGTQHNGTVAGAVHGAELDNWTSRVRLKHLPATHLNKLFSLL